MDDHRTSVPAAAIIEESRRRGYLAQQLYVILTSPADGIGPVMDCLADHLKFQEQLETDGVMFAAGPQWTDNEEEWEGDGMVIIRADSIEQAREIASRDPMHRCGARVFTLRPWMVNEGTISLKLAFATGRFLLS